MPVKPRFAGRPQLIELLGKVIYLQLPELSQTAASGVAMEPHFEGGHSIVSSYVDGGTS